MNLPKKRKITADARIWKRVLAFILDLTIVDMIVSTSHVHLIQPYLQDLSFNEIMTLSQTNSAFQSVIENIMPIYGLVALGYFILFEYLLMQTPGKMLLKLNIVPLKGKRLNWKQCFIRNLMFIPLPFFSLLIFVDAFYLFFNKIRFTEKISKTKLVEVFSV